MATKKCPASSEQQAKGRCLQPRRRPPLLLAGLITAVASTGASGLPAASQSFVSGGSGAVFAPNPGSLCDRANQLCFDQQGLSLGITRDVFGRYAEKNALRNLNGQAPPRQFLLSNGVACDVNVRLCWEDGWRRRLVSQRASQQLFGSGGFNGGGNQPSVNQNTGLCRLSRQLQVVYNGNCELREVQDGNRKRFVVTLGNGNRFSFDNRRGDFRISDASGGSWPVQFSDRGRSAEFRWADMSLQTTQNAYNGSTKPNLGRTLGQLLEALFN